MTEAAVEHELEVPGAGAVDELMPGVVSTPTALVISVDLRFNEWSRLLDTIEQVHERACWALGDARRYADERFDVEYADALEARDIRKPTSARCAWVARTFPEERRRDGLTFSHHEKVAALGEPEQELWLNEAERQGWSVRELADRLVSRRLTGARPHALQPRLIGDVVVRLEQRAAALGVKPRDLALEVLELASRLPDPVAALKAAGAEHERSST